MLLGLTGPSSFSTDCMEMIEQYFHANFVLLYHEMEENLNYWLGKVDGVILAGGIDIHPSIYGESVCNNYNLLKFDIKRDVRELLVINHCMEKQKPILAICRGHQLLGVFLGFHILQDLSNSSVSHSPMKLQINLSRNEPAHSVKLLNVNKFKEDYCEPENVEERKTIAKVFRKFENDRVWVNSFHHQGLIHNPNTESKHNHCRIMGVSRADVHKIENIVEFMDGPNFVSVQWHPEYDWRENSVSRSVIARYKGLLK